MKPCGRCGVNNTPDADFCGGCGAFLDFEESPAPASPAAQPVSLPPKAPPVGPVVPPPTSPVVSPPVSPPMPPPVGPRPPRIDRPAPMTGPPPVTNAPPVPQHAPPVPQHAPPGPQYAPPAPPYAPPGPSYQPPQAPMYPPQAPMYPPQAPMYPPQAPMYPPQAPMYPPQQVGPTQPVPVQPSATQQRRRPVEQVPAFDPTGAILCQRCGTGNDTTRRFCRRCGQPLVVAPERLRWWQRLKKWWKARKERDAGYRPNRRSSIRPGTVVLTGLLTIALIVGLTPPLRQRVVTGTVDGYNAIRDRMKKPQLVASRNATASSQATGNEAGKVNDAGNDTYWASTKPAPAEGEWVQVELERPVRLVSIIVTSGSSTDRPVFLTQARPHDVDVELETKDGKRITERISLQDRVRGQSFPVKGSDVVKVRLVVRSAYGAEAGRLVAVAELELFMRP